MSLTSPSAAVSIVALSSWVPPYTNPPTWQEIPNTDTFASVFGGSVNGIMVYSGAALDWRDSKWYFHGDGHAATGSLGNQDWDNRVVAVDLRANPVSASIVRQSTLESLTWKGAANLAASGGHNPDGRPMSTHTYHTMYVSRKLNRLMRLGAFAGSDQGAGSAGFWTVDGFRLANSNPPANLILPAGTYNGVAFAAGTPNYDWDPAGTYPNLPSPAGNPHGRVYVFDLIDDYAYFDAPPEPGSSWYRFDPANPTSHILVRAGAGQPYVSQAIGVLDRSRGWILTWNKEFASPIISRQPLDGSAPTDITSQVVANSPAAVITAMNALATPVGSGGSQPGWYHIEPLGLYLIFNGRFDPANPIIAFNPNTNAVNYFATQGFQSRTTWDGGIFNRFAYDILNKCLLIATPANTKFQALRILQ